MRFAWLLAAILVAGAGTPLGCSSSDNAGSATGSGGGGTGGDGPTDKPSIVLDADTTIDLAPGDTVTIRARLSGAPGIHHVAFTLLGSAADAALDATVVATDADGVATTRLHAPSVASTFLLRATLIGSDASDTVSIAVSRKGFATIDAIPQYGGVRKVTSWTATAVTRTSCAALAATLPEVPAGGLETTGSAKEKLSIHDVPVGPPVAVVVRAGHFAWGCIDSSELLPNAVAKLGVAVADKPLDLAATELDFALDFVPDPTELGMLAADGLEVVGSAVFGQKQDAAFLLDAMQAIAPGEFANARNEYGWDQIAAGHLAAGAIDLRSAVQAWAYAGLAIQPPSLALRVTGSAGDASNQTAKLTILTLGSFTPAEAGLTKNTSVGWDANAKDVVTLSGKVNWRPSALVASAALVGADAEFPGVLSLGDALAAEVDCPGLGDALGGYDQCDTGCLADLCSAALDAAWGPAPAASPAGSGSLAITISGQAKVDDTAKPRSVEGEWIGALGDANQVRADIKGAATATKTGSHSPP